MTFPQALISEKSALLVPSIRILLRESAVLPVFVRVTVWAGATEPTAGLANINLLGERFATGPGPMPTPVRGMTCGLLARSSVMRREPFRTPRSAGENTRLIWQSEATATLFPQLFTWVKSPFAVTL